MENITSANFNQVEAQQEQYFKCEKCERTFRRKSSFSRHVLSIHGEADILKLDSEMNTYCKRSICDKNK